jgi:glycosyltransferase involved in cell wall biosynthesis
VLLGARSQFLLNRTTADEVLENITPVILTYEEAPNIGRTLSKLSWAKEVVVLDSGSKDDTVGIASRYANVRVLTRPFDCHANQWNYAISETGIATDWVLALDADYVLSAELVAELAALAPTDDVSGYEARFVYCVQGKPLRATVYPPVTVLYAVRHARYRQDGHTQRVSVDGRVARLSGVIFHDDRKSLSRWVAAQERYARIEADKFHDPEWSPTRWQERIRQLRVFAPFAMLFYCLFVKRLVLDGWPGIFYSLQRALAELLLSLYLIQHDVAKRSRGNGRVD